MIAPNAHSLAEIAVIALDANNHVLNDIEAGWTIDATYGDALPHLFVFYWINGQPQHYNNICGSGWHQVSTKSGHTPGDKVAVTSNPEQYGIVYSQGNWWVNYQNDWIGFYPGSLWDGNFTSFTQVQWYGEVARPNPQQNPCTQMGNGMFGSESGAAKIDDMGVIDNQGGQWPANATDTDLIVSDSSLYDAGNFVPNSQSFHSFTYGGPGAC